ncbi:MAG: glutamine--fructose-6-phosphate transaminase (isomerizing) [Victivallales bacterium]|nr:glutamine--fructose-6-phosphate transaminase (isomerizing) [Victivallales bacterium]
MCGIVGYIGEHNVEDALINGLKRLEYRGYDSAGMSLLINDKIETVKKIGKTQNLHDAVTKKYSGGKGGVCTTGIAHTRWATHGMPTEENAHPHLDMNGNFALVHNGIIENYKNLKDKLVSHGYTFKSGTDTEVIVNLIDYLYEKDFFKAVAAALKELHGTFGIAVISKRHPGNIVVARRGSPIVVGLGTNEMLVGSDVSALVAYTRRVIYLNDDDIAMVKKDDVQIYNIDEVPVTRETALVDWDPGEIEKSGYKHFMLKEIEEQPDSVRNSIRGRIDFKTGTAILQGLNITPKEVSGTTDITITACGTSYIAGLVGEYYFEDLADIPTEVAQAAEFRYRNPILKPNSLVVAISQSGETADTLAAVREAAGKGASVVSLCNVVGSTIAREAGRGVYLHAGPEISVASTKAFTCQVAVLLMMALKFGRINRLSIDAGNLIADEIESIPEMISKLLKTKSEIEKIAEKYAAAEDFFYIGRGYMYPAALEGALKLKEISYIHAEGYHAAELKHGPIALLDEKVPVVALANDIPGKDKVIGNIQECRARKSPVIAVATEGDEEIKEYVEDIIRVPKTSKYIAPILTVIALQLFAYYIADKRGRDIDKPRNLAKSVTVE